MRNPVKLLAKYGFLFFAALFLTMILTWGLVKLFNGDTYIKQRALPTVISDRPDDASPSLGGEQFDYYSSSDQIPEGFDDEMDATAIQLIPERQTTELPKQEVPAADREELAEFVVDFLTQWETFTGGEGLGSYSQRISPFVTSERLDATAKRLSNTGPKEVGPCKACTSGSIFDTSRLDPGDYMIVRRMDDDTAYVTTHGMATYTGISIYSGKTVRRTYALILEREGSQWRVQRVVSETLKYA